MTWNDRTTGQRGGGWQGDGRQDGDWQDGSLPRLATGMFLLPFRLMGLGVGIMLKTARGLEGLAEGRSDVYDRRWKPGENPSWRDSGSSATSLHENSFHSEMEVGQGTVEGATTENRDAEKTNKKEDRGMSCCDQDLSGCELKVVQYTIVCVDPYMPDDERILEGPKVVATSDDMTESDFTAWVTAKYAGRHPHGPCKTQYLRVCFSVMCRLAMPCTDYGKENVDTLRSINETLKEFKNYDPDDSDSGGRRPGLPAKKAAKD